MKSYSTGSTTTLLKRPTKRIELDGTSIPTLSTSSKNQSTEPPSSEESTPLEKPRKLTPPSFLQAILLYIILLLQPVIAYLTPETSTTPKQPLQPPTTTFSTRGTPPKRQRPSQPDNNNEYPHMCGAYAPIPAPQRFQSPLILGRLPKETHGLFARVGPNPYYVPRGGYHVFDGDGCVASIRIRGGDQGAVGCWWGRVETEKLRRERVSGGIARRENLGGIVGIAGLIKGLGRLVLKLVGLGGDDSVANTNLCWWGGRLMALYEGGLPWALQVGGEGLGMEVVKTVGKVGFGGALEKMRFSAHPRPGPGGLLYSVNYKWMSRIPAEVVAVDIDGKVVKKIDVPLDRRPVIHDTCVTKRFVLVMDLPLVFSLKELLKGGLPVDFQENGKARFGLMPLNADSHEDILWFDVQSGFIFHTVAAWEEEDTNKVIFWACRMEKVDLSMGPEVKNKPKLWRWELDLNSGEAAGSLEYDEYDVEFPAVDETLLGGPVRYCYLSILERETLPTGPSPIEDVTGIVKYDLKERKKVAEIRFAGAEKHIATGGECQFIPRENAISEDDGYLMTLVHDWTLNRSELRIYDAKTMNINPVASIVMEGQRIPSGFHTIFIPENELNNQRSWM